MGTKRGEKQNRSAAKKNQFLWEAASGRLGIDNINILVNILVRN